VLPPIRDDKPTVAQRDYILRLIEQAAQLLAQITHQREMGQPGLAVQTVIDGVERLFGLTVSELGSLDEEALFEQLTQRESPENARDKCVVFAALNYQAGLSYEDRDLPALAQPAFHLALVFTLRARVSFPAKGAPEFTPRVDDLLYRLEGFELPVTTRSLLEQYRSPLPPIRA